VPLPESIPVKYTEEEAGSISMRPMVRQTFRAAELVDMVVSVAGKDPARVNRILHAGTVVFHSYRYWWQGLDAEPEKLEALLAVYPDAEPSRLFRAENCTEALFESGGTPPRHSLRLRREEVHRRGWFRSRTLWDALMDITRVRTPTYREYSYSLRGDIYTLQPDPAALAGFTQQAAKLAARSLRPQLAQLSGVTQFLFLCPRK
jgi:hypothetical protein